MKLPFLKRGKQTPHGQTPLERAQSLATAGDWHAAAAVWQSIAQANAGDAGDAALAYSEHGRCCLELGRLDEAQASLRQAQQLQADFMLAYRLLGWVAAALRDWRLAAEQWRAVLASDPPAAEQAEALVALIRALLELEDFAAAGDAVERLAIAADNPLVAKEQRALLAEKQDDLKTAAALRLQLAEAKQADPHAAASAKASAWTDHARICLYLGEFGAAKASLEHAFTLDANFIPARHILGRIATEQRDWPTAAAQWRAVLAADPQPPALAEVLYDFGGALIEMDAFTEAEATIERLAQVEEDKRNSLELRAALAEKQGEWDKAGKLWLDIALLSG